MHDPIKRSNNYRKSQHVKCDKNKTRMWADAQRDGNHAQPNIGGALFESSVIPFLVPRRKFWLRPAAGVSYSNAVNIRERKIWTQSEICTAGGKIPGRGQKPQKCTYGDDQRSCKVWLASGERRRCSNETKTQNQLKFAGVPQTGKPISAVSGPKFAIF